MRGGCVVSQWPIRRREVDRGKGKTARLSEETLQAALKWNYTFLCLKLNPRRDQRQLDLHSHPGEAATCSKIIASKVAVLLSQRCWVNLTYFWFNLLIEALLIQTGTQEPTVAPPHWGFLSRYPDRCMVDDSAVFFSSFRRTLVLISRMTATPSMAFQVSTRAPRTQLSPLPPKSAPLESRWWRKWR